MLTLPGFMQQQLEALKISGNLRHLPCPGAGLEDFSSNDYLGLSRCSTLNDFFLEEVRQFSSHSLGSTGSRLLTGNSFFAEMLEKEIADYHQSESALFFNSGYTANLSLFATLPKKNDTIITDNCIHASVIDGCRLSYAKRLHFRHNDLTDLEQKLRKAQGTCYVAVESLYSMEGDIAPLKEISTLCKKYGALLIVDEAHAAGVYGMGLVQEAGLEKDVFARVITYGKAFGTHGASITGSSLLKQYLINYARPFIFTTAPSLNQLLAVRCAYAHIKSHSQIALELHENIGLFRSLMSKLLSVNPGPIQLIQIPGNESVMRASAHLIQAGFDVRAVRSPTVPKGKERLRICLHSFNSSNSIIKLCEHLHRLISPDQ